MIFDTRARLAARNTMRRPARTLFTMGMVAVSVALLLIALSFLRGAFGSMIDAGIAASGQVRVVDPAFAEREELMPLYEHLPDAEALAEIIRRQRGVSAVEPRIITGVTITAGEEIGDVFALVVGARDSYFREQLAAHEHIVSGTWLSGAPDELVVGHTVARQVGAVVGDELVLLGATQDGSLSSIRGTLVGIARGGSGIFDRQVLAPLDRVQWLVDMPDTAVELLVYGPGNERTLADRLRALPELSGLAVQPWSEREPWRSTAGMVTLVERIVIFTFVFLAALGILNAMMMSVLERTSEIGVLRAMGLSRLGVIGLFVGEATVTAVAGGALGVALGAGPSWLLSRHGLTIGEQTASAMDIPFAETIHAELSAELALLCFGLGLLTAVLGTLLPALRAASVSPMEAMRSGR
jgi:putative ABC transport system permease protein